jgi:hypothetical protein
MSRLYSIFNSEALGLFSAVVLHVIIIVAICVGIAGLVVSLGKWKISMGLLPRFKSLTMARHHERGGISEHSDLPSH